MKVLFLTEPLTFSLIPRDYPSQGDDISVSFRNEMTDRQFYVNFTFTITDTLNITLTSEPSDFATQNKYEIEIKNESDLIYLGNLIVLESGTDVQNYENATQTNERFKYK